MSELRDYAHATSNDDWENAHQESFFFHLAGAIEGVLHEINDAYSLGFRIDGVSLKPIRKQLQRTNQVSDAFLELDRLRGDATSWLSLLFEWRNHGAHRRRVGTAVRFSTHRRIDNEFVDPRSGKVQTVYSGAGCLQVIERLFKDAAALIDQCRRRDLRLVP